MRKFLVLLVVLLLLAVGADRVAEKVAVDRAETRLRAEGVADPQVSVSGFPFLTQLAQRRFTEVTMTAPSLDSSAGSARDLHVDARDVEVPQGGTARAGSVTASGLVTYAEVLRKAGTRGVHLEPAGAGRVRLRGTAEVLGQSVPVAALGRVHTAGRTLKVVPSGFQVGGAELGIGALPSSVIDRFTLTYPLRDLPSGLTVKSVQPRPTGFRVVLTGTDVSVPTGG